MAWFYPAVQAVGSYLTSAGGMAAMSAVTAGVTAYGSYQQGRAERSAANAMAAQQEIQAGQERAVAQLERARQKRIHASKASEQRSLMAASGFASDDPTAINLASETAGAQTLEELLTLAQGEETARQMGFGATQSRAAGENAYKSGVMNAATTLMGSATSWYDRYGGGSRAPSAPGAPKKPMPNTRAGNRKLVAG